MLLAFKQKHSKPASEMFCERLFFVLVNYLFACNRGCLKDSPINDLFVCDKGHLKAHLPKYVSFPTKLLDTSIANVYSGGH